MRIASQRHLRLQMLQHVRDELFVFFLRDRKSLLGILLLLLLLQKNLLNAKLRVDNQRLLTEWRNRIQATTKYPPLPEP